MTTTACVFDAYGTLFDLASAAARVAADRPDFADRAEGVTARWREKQVAYTFHRAVTGDHATFDRVAADALDYALAEAGLDDAGLREDLLAAFGRLDAYPEAAEVLRRLRAGGCATAILSNGTPATLAAATEAAGLAPHLDAVLSVEAAGVFKPAPAVYDLPLAQFGVTRDAVLFVSSNSWDIAGAARAGLSTAWVNRSGGPADRLGHPAGHVADDLTAIPALAGVH